ncbi:TPA: hypothetical protein R1869_000335 [Klebsiella oxytoca]|nr:hypothetical protein [Klebsiella oxytoca]
MKRNKTKKKKRNSKGKYSSKKSLYSINKKYSNYMSSDFKICHPLLNENQILYMMYCTHQHLKSLNIELEGVKKIAVDLDQLMTLDYRSLPNVTDRQKMVIEKLFNSAPISPDELIFQALRTVMFTSFPLPENEEALIKMCYYRHIENDVALNIAHELSEKFSEPMVLQPYWPRLSQLRIMMHIPEHFIRKTELDNIIFYPVKLRGMNATSLVYENTRFIRVNYALEPILDDFNTILIHFHSTEAMAGAKRYLRALTCLIPRALYFSTEISPLKFPPNPICFEDSPQLIHELTAEQIDFIMMHELSHHLFKHPQRKHEVLKNDDAIDKLKEFELEADYLPAKMMLLKFYDAENRSKKRGDEKIPFEVIKSRDLSIISALILFEHMHFVEEANEILKGKLNGILPVNFKLGTHPPSKERKEKFLEALGDRFRGSSPLSRYASSFYENALRKLNDMSSMEIMEVIKPCLYE